MISITTCTEYAKSLQNIDVADDAEFYNALLDGIRLLGVTDRDIAHTFGVTRPTVARWKNKRNAPHPAMRTVVYNWLRQTCLVWL